MTHKFKSLITLYLAGMVVLQAFIFWNDRELLRKGYSDFAIYYGAGGMVRQGLRHELYDQSAQFRVQQQFAGEVKIRQGPLPYNHPPFETLLFVPFARLPYFTAFLLWDAANLLLLLALPFLLRSNIPAFHAATPGWWSLASVAFFPVLAALLQGQDVIILLLFFTLAFVALKRERDFCAGCWLGLGLFRFQMVLPFVLILMLQKRRRALAGFGATALALGLVSVAVAGWHATLAYPGYVWHVENSSGGAIFPAEMPNLRGLLDAILTPRLPGIAVQVVTFVLSLTLIVLAAIRWKRAGTMQSFDIGFALAMTTSVVVSYHAFPHDLTLLLLPILLVANHVHATGSHANWSRILLLGPILILFANPLLIWLQFGHMNILAVVLLLWIWGIAQEAKRLGDAC